MIKTNITLNKEDLNELIETQYSYLADCDYFHSIDSNEARRNAELVCGDKYWWEDFVSFEDILPESNRKLLIQIDFFKEFIDNL